MVDLAETGEKASCKSDTEFVATDTVPIGTIDWRVSTEVVVTDRTSSGENRAVGWKAGHQG
jgi:hypothetical protein